MTHVTPVRIDDRATAVASVLDAWVRALRAFSSAGVYPVDTGIPGVHLDRASHAMLRELDQGGPRRLGDLARAGNLHASQASRLAETLVRDGLVERTVPADDRRVTILEVSPAGRRAGKRIERQFVGLIADRLRDFDEREVVDFAKQFQRFAAEMAAWSGTSVAPASEGANADA